MRFNHSIELIYLVTGGQSDEGKAQSFGAKFPVLLHRQSELVDREFILSGLFAKSGD